MEINTQMRWESKVIEDMPETHLWLDPQNEYISQVPGVGIILAKMTIFQNHVNWKFKNIANFTISNVEVIENEDDTETIKFNANHIDGTTIFVEGSPKMFNGKQTFKRALNNKRFEFNGSAIDLQLLKSRLAETLKG